MNEDIRIMFFSCSYPYWGGVERWLVFLSNALKSKGFDVKVCLFEGNEFNKPTVFANSLQLDDYVALPALSGALEAREYVIEKAIHEFKPSIVIPVLTSDALSVASKNKKKYGYKIIFPVHEFGAGVCSDINCYSEFIDKVISVDELSSEFLPSYLNLNLNKFETIHACFDTIFQTPINKIKTNAVGIVGRWSDDKCSTKALDISQQLVKSDTSIKIRWAGLDPSIVEEIDQIKQLVDSGQLEILGELTLIEMKDFYQKIDCLLITSSHETGPLVAWEAMSQGVLVVTSEYLGLRAQNFLKNGKNCLVYPAKNTNDAVNKVLEGIYNTELFNKITKQAYLDICSNRSLELMLDKWAALVKMEYVNNERRFSKMNDFILYLKFFVLSFKEQVRQKLNIKYRPKSSREEWPPHLNLNGDHEHAVILDLMREFESSFYGSINEKS